jgi:triosephosphate isomerase (TIM)
MARRPLIAGNWKMNGSLASLAELDAIADCAARTPDIDVAICPPFTLIASATARQPNLRIGGQDCHANASGAHTGCISAAMLIDAGANSVIVGHSERRADNGESDADVAAKAEAAIAAGLTVILCVGETEAVRDAGNAIRFVANQLLQSLPTHINAGRLVIAYEPVWAIGTGRVAAISDIAEMHAAIRDAVADKIGDAAQTVRILYGGSVKTDNAKAILALTNVDGALVGGASLKASDFNAIIAAA